MGSGEQESCAALIFGTVILSRQRVQFMCTIQGYGLNVSELLMTVYMSAGQERTIAFPPPNLESFVPAVARGEWNPKK
jgi:hypothetical protein